MDLQEVANDLATMEYFITGGGLEDALHEIGAAELDVGLDIVQNIQEERDLAAAIQRMLGHFESAYSTIYKSLTFRRGILRPDRAARAEYQIECICALIALCHKWLGNSDKLVLEWLVKKPYRWPYQNWFVSSFVELAEFSSLFWNPFTYKMFFLSKKSWKESPITYDFSVALLGEEYLAEKNIMSLGMALEKGLVEIPSPL